MKTIDKKIPGGKLIRIDFEKSNNRIPKIQITGDFFIHPEDAIEEIEKIILSNDLSETKQHLETYLQKHGVEIIGFTIADLVKILNNN